MPFKTLLRIVALSALGITALALVLCISMTVTYLFAGNFPDAGINAVYTAIALAVALAISYFGRFLDEEEA